MPRFATPTALLVASLLVLPASAQAANEIHKSFNLPAQFEGTIQASNCLGSPGPQVVLQGDLTLSGLRADVIFSNLIGAPSPQDEVVVERIVVPQNEPVGLPQQTVVGGIGNNPYMWLQITDEKGRPLTSEIFLGRCEQGVFTPTTELTIPVEAVAGVTAAECESTSGPVVSVVGEAELSALAGKLIFRSGIAPGNLRGQPDAIIELVISPAGQTFQFPADPALGEVGGNPLVSLQLRDGAGAEIGSEIQFGRCLAISN